MRDMIVRVISVLTFVVDIIFGKMLPWASNLYWQSLVPVIAILSLIVYFWIEISTYRREVGLIFGGENKKSKIATYMKDWISKSDRMAIFSRDLSWAEEKSVKDLLKQKALKKELIICVPKSIELTRELESLGASVLTYEKLNYDPKSRFTIINFNRDGAHIAIGREIKEKHKIEEFSAADHPVFSVAMDLVEILKRYNETQC